MNTELKAFCAYRIDWRSGYIGGQVDVYTGCDPNSVIKEIERREGCKIVITKAVKKRGKTSPGVGTPQSKRDK